jgi:hypothetical protein
MRADQSKWDLKASEAERTLAEARRKEAEHKRRVNVTQIIAEVYAHVSNLPRQLQCIATFRALKSSERTSSKVSYSSSKIRLKAQYVISMAHQSNTRTTHMCFCLDPNLAECRRRSAMCERKGTETS